jgi:hypothetical protein
VAADHKCYHKTMALQSRLLSRPKTKLITKEHTGRVRSHRHTSYGSLLLVIGLAMLPVLAAQHVASAGVGDTSGGGSSQIYASVPTAVPSSAPQITNLANGRVLTTNDSLQVSGNCQTGSTVKIFKNEVLAGSTVCKGGTFNVSIDLFIGSNSLTARAYNADGIAGPESAPIIIRLLPPGASSAAGGNFDASAGTAAQFYITSDAYYRGVSSGQTISWPITIVGGQAPYSLQVSWGDGKTDTINRGTAGAFTISHSYAGQSTVSGAYTISIKAVDQLGQPALLQLSAVAPSQAGLVSSQTSHTTWISTHTAIQALMTSALIVISFWVGERYELGLVRRKATAV